MAIRKDRGHGVDHRQERVEKYSRQNLRKVSKFVEGDYNGINPREFYRRLKRRLEEIQTSDGFKYNTIGTQDFDLEIISEEVGEKTGRVEGRHKAESDWEIVGTGELEYKKYGPHGAWLIVIGAVVGIAAVLIGELLWSAIGLVSLVAGVYLYAQDDNGEYPVARKDIIRTLITGEVSERTIESEREERTDIFANMSVIYAGDIFVNIYTERPKPGETVVPEFEELDWTLRRKLVKEVKNWYNSIVPKEREVPVEDGFIDALSAWSNRSVGNDRREIDKIQNIVNQSFDYRVEYTEQLLHNVQPRVRVMIEEQHLEIEEELSNLAKDMDVFVDREGYQHAR